MGERILRDSGYEVVSLTDGNAALLRIADVDPDLILADVSLPGKSGYEICRFVKNDSRFKHVRVVLTAGMLEPLDEDRAKQSGCDAILRKPFEASRVASIIDPLIKDAQVTRSQAPQTSFAPPPEQPVTQAIPEPLKPTPAPVPLEVDAERVRAAVTVALDAAMPAMIEEITERVLIALGQ